MDVGRVGNRRLVEAHDGLELAPVARRKRPREEIDRFLLRCVDALLRRADGSCRREHEVRSGVGDRAPEGEAVDLAVREGRELAARLLHEDARAVLHERLLEIGRVRVERIDLALGEGGVLLAPVEDDELEILVDVDPFAREERA